MARYIDADKLKEELQEEFELEATLCTEEQDKWFRRGIMRAIRYVDRIPTADVVEVVRCEKCKYGDVSIISKAKDGEEDIACYCTLKKVITNIDSYCPSGRRRDT